MPQSITADYHPLLQPPRAALQQAEIAMRLLMVTITLMAGLLCFTRHGGGAFGFWLLIVIIGIFATALVVIHERIAGSARNQSLSAYELKQLRQGKDPLARRR